MNNFKKIVCILICCVLILGIVYVAFPYVKSILKKPEKIAFEDDKTITEKNMEESISEAEAKEIVLNILKDMNLEHSNIIETSFSNVSEEILRWTAKTDNNYIIQINAKNGKLVNITNNNLFNNEISETKIAENEAIEIAKELFDKLPYDYNKENYEFSNISKTIMNQWQADFCIKYDDIFNPYQCLRLTFIAESKELVMLHIFDYEFENNPYEITKEKAIDIVKSKLR